MAMQKSYTLPNDNSADYWKILRIEDNFHESKCDVVLGLFKDATARGADAQVCGAIGIHLEGDDYPLGAAALNPVDHNPYLDIYEQIKTMDAVQGMDNDTIDFTTGVTDV